MSRWLRALPALCFAAVLGAAACISAADARADVLAWRGRLSIGYGKLFFNGAPGGGFSTLVGVDLPVRSRFRLGPEIAFHLLGTRSIDSGGANANIDYSLFEFGVQAHWLPAHAGMIHRVSLGPAMMRSRVTLWRWQTCRNKRRLARCGRTIIRDLRLRDT